MILFGILHCPTTECRLEFPIIDGIPVIVSDVRAYLTSSGPQILQRTDLPECLSSLIGDAIGPASEYDQTRQQLSTYAWSHYGEFDPAEDENPQASGLIKCLDAGLAFITPQSPAIDLGCSVGRTTFELANRTKGLTIGVDLNFAMLQLAQDVLRTGQISYDRRRIGVAYDRRDFPVHVPAREEVDFWACDMLALPFAPMQFGTVVALNVLDCISSPQTLLVETRRILMNEAGAVLSTPYDWSPAATPIEGWIGGHSQRGGDQGDGPARLVALLAGTGRSVSGLRLVGEALDVEWSVRLHSRNTVIYRNHVLAVDAI